MNIELNAKCVKSVSTESHTYEKRPTYMTKEIYTYDEWGDGYDDQ